MTIVQPDKDDTDLRVSFQPPTQEEIAAARPAKTVHEALSDVMADVQAVRKTGRNEDQGYPFRGIDAVVNAVGPALRKHRVLILPQLLSVAHRDVTTSRGKPSRECTVKVRYRFIGPDESELEVEVPGESMDTSDKGTAKAMSVAYRIALLQTLCIPTDDPDPDEHTIERGNASDQPQQQSQPQDPEREAAITAVGEAWRLHHGEWDLEKVKAHFFAWSNGEVLTEAPNERLDEYAAALAATEEPA